MTTIAHGSGVPASGPQLDNRRVLAALIDLAVIGAGAAVIFAAAGAIGAPLIAVVLGWALYYYFACESGAGQTLGKKVMKIRVVRTDGAPAGVRDIAIRTVARLIDMQFVYLVGLIAMLVTGERRGRLGDLAAGTMIVTADGDTTAAPAPAAAAAASPGDPETITLPRREPVAAEPEPVVEAEPEPVVEADPEPVAAQPEPEPAHPGLRPLKPLEPLEDDAPEDESQPDELPPAAADLPDVVSPSLKELAEDVAAAMESTLAEDSTADAGRR
jgi:uncharacterized RDD family membrane protein YckC